MTVTENVPASVYDEGLFTIPLMDSGSIFNGYWDLLNKVYGK